MIIPGAEGVMTGICCMQLYIDTAVQTGGLNFSFYLRFHVQETLKIDSDRCDKNLSCIKLRHRRTCNTIP